jgi:hypothetical protein
MQRWQSEGEDLINNAADGRRTQKNRGISRSKQGKGETQYSETSAAICDSTQCNIPGDLL